MVGRRLLGLGLAVMVASAATTYAFASNWVHVGGSGARVRASETLSPAWALRRR